MVRGGWGFTNLAAPGTEFRFFLEMALDNLALEEDAILARIAAVVIAAVGVHDSR